MSWERVTACGKDQIVRIAVSIIPERLSDEDFSVHLLLPGKEGRLSDEDFSVLFLLPGKEED
ncbi:MAG TPA: hypothetical protein PLO24_02895 [Bacteroidales bacterium]|nr:hypothetical protein [Bacteroidales bacterium]HOS71393.1 hypothetical protein [Bacteroidales bacterium]HQH24763.1 hypothetical protein [Bacteroidales bacterium]HQJ82940.1 hypothetical protein [Bacteroidales bacterium]